VGSWAVVEKAGIYLENLLVELAPIFEKSMGLYEEDVEGYIESLYLTTLLISVGFLVLIIVYYLALIRVRINQLIKDMHAELRFL
jgi:hypothetical protein